jgi:hypothetical protein
MFLPANRFLRLGRSTARRFLAPLASLPEVQVIRALRQRIEIVPARILAGYCYDLYLHRSQFQA